MNSESTNQNADKLCYRHHQEIQFLLSDIQAACAASGLSFDLGASGENDAPTLHQKFPVHSGVRVVFLTVQRVRSLLRQSVVNRLHTVSILRREFKNRGHQ